ncbi:MAG: aspartate carbamoyltransferase catalytic subunit [Alphaproteobacteria bacterium]
MDSGLGKGSLLESEARVGRHLLGIEGLSPTAITLLLDRATEWSEKLGKLGKPPSDTGTGGILSGRVVINLFFEHSTRTRTSFEVSAYHLGADVVNIDTKVSSISKGETLLDTALILNAYRPAVLVVRHPDSGAVDLLAQKVGCSTINAGDGRHEHPTQALLDALTIRQFFGRLEGLKVALCGDVLHSRVARSNYHLLRTMGAEVRLVGPDTLLPSAGALAGASRYLRLEDGLRDVDVVMMLRLQIERMEGSHFPSVREYYHFWGLTPSRLGVASEGALVLHPGPMNRGVEIGSEVADDIKRSAVVRQLENGVAVRCACLELVAGAGG